MLYAPTYRAPADRAASDPIQLAAHLRGALSAVGIDLSIALHPLDRHRSPWRGSKEAAIDMLIETDLLITDYSSLVFDAAVFSIPTIIFAPDLSRYVSGPGLNLSVDRFCPGGVLSTVDSVVESVLAEQSGCTGLPGRVNKDVVRRLAVVPGADYKGATALAREILSRAG